MELYSFITKYKESILEIEKDPGKYQELPESVTPFASSLDFYNNLLHHLNNRRMRCKWRTPRPI